MELEYSVTSWLEKNWQKLLLVLLLLLFVVLGVGAFILQRDKIKTRVADKIYNFEEISLKEFHEKKIEATELWNRYLKLLEEENFHTSFSRSSLVMVDRFLAIKKVDLAQQALEVLIKKLPSDPYVQYFFYHRMALVYDQKEEWQKGLDVLKKIQSLSVKIFPEEIYFLQGRMFEKLNKKEDSQKALSFLVKEFPQSKFASLARIYLQRQQQN